MAQTQGIRMKTPAHSGGFVKTEIIEPLGLSVTDAARALGITRAARLTLFDKRRMPAQQQGQAFASSREPYHQP